MEPGRRLAFDYGSARIGVAISDLSGLLASPQENIDATSPLLSQLLLTLFEENEPTYIVVGKPLHLSGADSAKADSVRTFVSLLKSITTIPIYLLDERLTTVSASRSLREAGINSKAGKSKIDGAAAVGILESALHQERLQGAPSQELA